MRWLPIGFLLLACILPLAAEDWTTADGHVYHNVTVVGQDSDGVRITYDGGVGKIPYYLLPVDIQKKFGQDVDSLAAKKHAIDKAIEDAVRAAGDAQITAAPAIAPNPPAYIPPPAPTPGPGTGVTTTGPGNAPGGTNPAVAPAPGAQTNAAPHPVVVAHVATNAPPETPEVSPPPVSHTPNPGVNGNGGKPLQLTVSNYTYSESLDVCYLDSPPLDAFLVTASKTPQALGSSLTLRVVTDGRTPQQPDRFELTFVCVGSNGDLSSATIVFNSDAGAITVPETDKKDSGTLPGAQATSYVSFYLSAAQVRQFSKSKDLTFIMGAYTYRLDDRGAAVLRSYLADVDTLEPASSSFVHSIYKMLARIPSFFSIISTICEYVILGSFGLLLMFSIAAFILGITRFIKM